MQSFIKIHGSVLEKSVLKKMTLCNFDKEDSLGLIDQEESGQGLPYGPNPTLKIGILPYLVLYYSIAKI